LNPFAAYHLEVLFYTDFLFFIFNSGSSEYCEALPIVSHVAAERRIPLPTRYESSCWCQAAKAGIVPFALTLVRLSRCYDVLDSKILVVHHLFIFRKISNQSWDFLVVWKYMKGYVDMERNSEAQS
jgi:hypothetical protein